MVLYLIPGFYLYFTQTSLLYEGYATPVVPSEARTLAKAVGLTPWYAPGAEASGPQGYVQTDFAKLAPRGTVFFLHGNGESAWEWVEQVAPFTRRGFRVFLYEYPGFGGRPGTPSEKTIVPDARAVIRALAGVGLGPVYVWGQSLGSGVAAAVCADPTLPIQGLTLVTPWDTLPNVGALMYPYYPVRLFMHDRYDSIANLQHFGHPVCLILGDRDDTILPALSRNLFAHLPNPKKMILKAGYGHGDWPIAPELPWWDEALDFIAPKAGAVVTKSP